MHSNIPEQLTFGSYGHTLHHCQVMSPDNSWVVYDTRNEDTEIGITTRIERVNLVSKSIEIVYRVDVFNQYGPGVGAVTYAPNDEIVLFIHGLKNASKVDPYAMDRRSGVGVRTSNPNVPIHFDARQIEEPFVKGSLSGGTHSHCWHNMGKLISYTYNDFLLTKNLLPNERVVGIMFPEEVTIDLENDENFSGSHYSVIVTDIKEKAIHGSDEIEKAFDECWVGSTNQVAFQGWVRTLEGHLKTEIFVITLPENLELLKDSDEFKSNTSIFKTPKAVNQKRVSYTLKGVSKFRHWLRSSPDGKYIYFIMEDEANIRNIYRISLSNKQIQQVTFHEKNIDSPFNISNNGLYLVYIMDKSLVLFDLETMTSRSLIVDNKELNGIPNFDKNDQFIIYNQYVNENLTSKFLQIFKIKI